MASYTRFEIYLPVVYTSKKDGEVHSLPEDLVGRFINESVGRYRGISRANPVAAAPLKGWWQENPNSPASVDYITYLFGLVRIDQTDDATRFFESWQETFERDIDQQVVLIIYYPVHTIGDFF